MNANARKWERNAGGSSETCSSISGGLVRYPLNAQYVFPACSRKDQSSFHPKDWTHRPSHATLALLQEGLCPMSRASSIANDPQHETIRTACRTKGSKDTRPRERHDPPEYRDAKVREEQ